jgi:hypothetical protein
MATDDTDEDQDLERQAADAIRAAALRLLEEGRVHPRLVVLAVARVAGELGASAALAGGEDAEALLAELAGFLREAGREHREALALATGPTAGSA